MNYYTVFSISRFRSGSGECAAGSATLVGMNSPNYLVCMRVKYELTTKGLVSRGSDPDPVNVQPDPHSAWQAIHEFAQLFSMDESQG